MTLSPQYLYDSHVVAFLFLSCLQKAPESGQDGECQEHVGPEDGLKVLA